MVLGVNCRFYRALYPLHWCNSSGQGGGSIKAIFLLFDCLPKNELLAMLDEKVCFAFPFFSYWAFQPKVWSNFQSIPAS